MDGTEHLEIERKYDVDEVAATPELLGVAGIASVEDAETVRLAAEYYDTEDRALAASRAALRRRIGGEDEGWHLKTSGDRGRLERHWPLDDDGEIPAGVLATVAQLVPDARLAPIAHIGNRRVLRRLLDADRRPLAELCDDHVETVDLGTGIQRSWREWEVELLGRRVDDAADTRLLDAIERVLVAAGARPSASSSKLARALLG